KQSASTDAAAAALTRQSLRQSGLASGVPYVTLRLSQSSPARISRLEIPAGGKPPLSTCRRPASACVLARPLSAFASRSISVKLCIAKPFILRLSRLKAVEDSFDDCVLWLVCGFVPLPVVLKVLLEKVADSPIVPEKLPISLFAKSEPSFVGVKIGCYQIA